jgi:hypothetical protein
MHHSQSQKTSKASPKAKKGAASVAATKGKSAKATGSKPKKTEKVRLAPSSSCCTVFLSLFAYLRRDSLRNAKRAQSNSHIISQIF